MALFSHLNVHSEYSLMESTVKINDLISAAVRKGMKAVALTDTCVMSGIIKFYEEATSRNIRPVAGCEICVDNGNMLSNLIILIRNGEGYENLCELVSKSHLEKRGPIPVIKLPDLQERAGGLIGITCFKTGEIPLLVKAGKAGEAMQSASCYREIFKNNFFLEIQRCRKAAPYPLPFSKIIINFAAKHKLPMVATNNVHYLNKHDYITYKYLLKIKSMGTKNISRSEPVENDQYYFKSPSEMVSLFHDIPEAISNTGCIAEKCNLKLPISRISSLSGKTPQKNRAAGRKLIKLCFKNGIKRRYEKNNPPVEAVSRLKKELKTIIHMGLCGYFLVAAEIADFARKNNIPICGKGSSAGSIVSYLLGISDIDPVTNNLYFQRFLNKERKEIPDIDIDVSSKRRAELINHLSSIYGRTGISRVCIFSTLKTRASLREAGRILGYGSGEVNEIIKEKQDYFSLYRASRYSDNGKGDNADYADIKNICGREMAYITERIKNYPRHISMHPSAFIISTSGLERKIPLRLSETGEIVSQYDITSIEKLGLLKIDLISSTTLSLIDDVAEILKNKRNINFNISRIDYNDSRVFNLIKNGKTLGVFQLESSGIRKLATKIKPSSINDITHLISLYRPAPASTGMVKNFIRRKSGIETPDCPHKDLKTILDETYGIILYQEQVMKIAVKIAGYSLSEADDLRKSIGCSSTEKIKNEGKKFVKGAADRGYSIKTAKGIFKLISRFTSYSFVKAHAAAYACLSYRACYIKAYYPAELISVILTNNSGYYSSARYIEEARRLGIKIKLPDINKSGFEFSAEDEGKSIRISLPAVRELGHSTVQSILGERTRNGKFKNFSDFYYRTSENCKITERATANLIKAGAFDFAEANRKKLLFYYHYLKNACTGESTARDRSFLLNRKTSRPGDFSPGEKLLMEEKILGFCASHSPLYYFTSELKKYHIVKSSSFPGCRAEKGTIFTAGIVINRKIKKTRGGRNMLFCTIEDAGGMYEVLFLPDTFEKNFKIIMRNSVLIIEGKLFFREKDTSLIGRNAISLMDLKKAGDMKRKDTIKNKLLAKSKPAWGT